MATHAHTKRPRYKRKDATKPLKFTVTADHVREGVCSDPDSCVLALAIIDALGDLFERVQVGLTSTKVYRADGVIVRYRTPIRLKLALQEFDRTGNWSIPMGDYQMKPPKYKAGIRNRVHLMTPEQKKGGPNRNNSHKRRAAPTRTTCRINAAIPE